MSYRGKKNVSFCEEEQHWKIFYSVKEEAHWKRADKFLANALEGVLSRTCLQQLFKTSSVEFLTLKQREIIQRIPQNKIPLEDGFFILEIPPPIDSHLIAENIPLEILFEDEHLLFINKPAGMVSHPAPGNYSGTLINAILFHCQSLREAYENGEFSSEVNSKENIPVFRPGLPHRLDKGTTGVMVVAKHRKALEGLIELFAAHEINREYLALCSPMSSSLLWQQKSCRLESVIGRSRFHRQKMTTKGPLCPKRAVTGVTVEEEGSIESRALFKVRLRLETGRTHQIRVHLSELLKAPILHDGAYGGYKTSIEYEHPLLHAHLLGFCHPITKKYQEFSSPLPAIWEKFR